MSNEMEDGHSKIDTNILPHVYVITFIDHPPIIGRGETPSEAKKNAEEFHSLLLERKQNQK